MESDVVRVLIIYHCYLSGHGRVVYLTDLAHDGEHMTSSERKRTHTWTNMSNMLATKLERS